MGNVYRYPPYSSTNLLLFLFFINTHEYAKLKMCISAHIEEKTMSELQFGTRVSSLG